MTFAEQVPGLTSPHSRFTPLLRALLTQIALALAGARGCAGRPPRGWPWAGTRYCG